MGKFEKKKESHIKTKVSVIFVVLLLPVILCVFLFAKENRNTADDISALAEEPTTNYIEGNDAHPFLVKEEDNQMIISSKYFDFSIPNTFAEVLSIEPVDYGEEYALEFYTQIWSQNIPLYTLWVGRNAGVVLGTLPINNDVSKIVSIEFYDSPAELSDSGQNTFFAAQETSNDVVQSLSDILEPYTPNYSSDSEIVEDGEVEKEQELNNADTSKPDEGASTLDESTFSVKEDGQQMVITSEMGTLFYPTTYAELLEVLPEENNNHYSLHFYCKFAGNRMAVYTIRFGVEEGTLLGFINEKAVSIEFHEAPVDMVGDVLESFYSAQETANDVILSLQTRDDFRAP